MYTEGGGALTIFFRFNFGSGDTPPSPSCWPRIPRFVGVVVLVLVACVCVCVCVCTCYIMLAMDSEVYWRMHLW